MSLSEGSWQKIQQEMDHVAQFRSLNERDWDNLCAAIQAEILSHPDQDVCQADFIKDCGHQDIDRRVADRRQAERRDYSRLADVSKKDWSSLCKRIYTLTMAQRVQDERNHADRRKGDRRQSD